MTSGGKSEPFSAAALKEALSMIAPVETASGAASK
jgi:hypothetical protein